MTNYKTAHDIHRRNKAGQKRLMETTGMRVCSRTAGKPLVDKNISESIRGVCRVDKVNGWVLKQRKEWNEHIDRME